MIPLLTAIALFLFGALVTHVWNRYRNRLKRLRWSVQYIGLAVAVTDPRLGAVQVLYNGAAVTNLHFATVQVQNESTSDVQDLVVNFGCIDGSRILASFGLPVGGLQYIPYNADFTRVINDNDPAHAPARMEYLSKRRDFQITVLNRGAGANFVLLLLRDDTAQPSLTVACNHPGVEFVHEPPAPMIPMVVWGVRLSRLTIAIGLVAGVVATAVLARYITSTWIVGFGAWLVGISSTMIAVSVSKFVRWILRMLS